MRRHLNANRGQSVLAHDMAFWDPFSQQVAQMKYIFLNWDSLHERLNSHCKAWSYKKKKRKRIKAYRKSLQKEPIVSRCLLILDLSHTPKLEQLNHQIAFCIWGRPHWIRDGKLNILGYFYFYGCWFTGLGLRISEIFKYPKYWKRDITLP